jgi:hypothetical protein
MAMIEQKDGPKLSSREIAKRKRNELKAQCILTEKLFEGKLHFTHVRLYDSNGDVEKNRGCTLAWQRAKYDHGNFVEVAVAWCHERDCYDKVIGRALAAEDFRRGIRILIRLPEKKEHPSWQLAGIFGRCLGN